MSLVRPLFVVAGIGNGTVVYSPNPATESPSFPEDRGPEHLHKLAAELNQTGAEVATFPLKDYKGYKDAHEFRGYVE